MRTVDWSFGFINSDNQLLLNIIKKLSEEYLDGSVFLPHITFYAPTSINDEMILEIINKIKLITTPFKINLDKISYAEKESKTLFIQVKPSEEMNTIYSFIKNEFHLNYDFTPHISLIYKKALPIDIRETLSMTIKFPHQVTIDSIILTEAEKGKNEAKYFKDWKTQRYPF